MLQLIHEKSVADNSLTTLEQSSDLVTINVSGRIFLTQANTLNRFPDTLLGDPLKRNFHYNDQINAYFFDRHAACFEYVLSYYQTNGQMHWPTNLPLSLFVEEMRFFGLENDETRKILQSLYPQEKRHTHYVSKYPWVNKIWSLLDNGTPGFWGKLPSILTIIVVLFTVSLACVETLPQLEAYVVDRGSNNTSVNVSEWVIHDGGFKYSKEMYCIEIASCIWFSLEIILRFTFCPHKLEFFRDVLNIIDLVAIIPQYITLGMDYQMAMENDANMHMDGKNASQFLALRTLRLLRILRIFKLSRHSKRLRVLGRALTASYKEMFLLVFMVFVGTLLFASFIYYCEYDYNRQVFRSIPHSFWFAIVTMTTVGYGDMVPVSIYGKLVGSVCTLTGVLLISMSVPVIVNNFLKYYDTVHTNPVEKATIKYVGFCHISTKHTDDNFELHRS